MKKQSIILIIGAIIGLNLLSWEFYNRGEKDFNYQNTGEIGKLIKNLDKDSFSIVSSAYHNQKTKGNQIYSSLPTTEIKKTAFLHKTNPFPQ